MFYVFHLEVHVFNICNFDRFIYTRFAAPPFAAGAVLLASLYGGWLKTSHLLLGVYGSKFMTF